MRAARKVAEKRAKIKSRAKIDYSSPKMLKKLKKAKKLKKKKAQGAEGGDGKEKKKKRFSLPQVITPVENGASLARAQELLTRIDDISRTFSNLPGLHGVLDRKTRKAQFWSDPFYRDCEGAQGGSSWTAWARRSSRPQHQSRPG